MERLLKLSRRKMTARSNQSLDLTSTSQELFKRTPTVILMILEAPLG